MVYTQYPRMDLEILIDICQLLFSWEENNNFEHRFELIF